MRLMLRVANRIHFAEQVSSQQHVGGRRSKSALLYNQVHARRSIERPGVIIRRSDRQALTRHERRDAALEGVSSHVRHVSEASRIQSEWVGAWRRIASQSCA